MASILTHNQSINRILFNLAVCLSFILVQLDVSVVNVSINALSNAFNADIADLEWVINCYSLVFAALLLSSGSISDKFGTKRTFLFGVILFIIASLSCALSSSLTALEFSRGIQGIGAALLVPGSLTLIRHYYHDDQKRRSYAISLWATSGSLALAAGPIIGGWLIELTSWKSIFVINIPLGLICIILTVRYARVETTPLKKINIIGQALIILSLSTLTFSLTESARIGWDTALVKTTFLIGLTFLGFFVYYDNNTDIPVIPSSIKNNSTIRAAAFVGFLCTLIFYGNIFSVSLFFQKYLNQSPASTGMLFLPMMLAVILASYNSGRIVDQIGIRFVAMIGGAISLSGSIWMIWAAQQESSFWLLPGMVLTGAGTSIIVPGLADVILSRVDANNAGSASAFYSSARQVGGVFGVAIFGLFLSGPEKNLPEKLSIISMISGLLILIWILQGGLRLPNNKTRN